MKRLNKEERHQHYYFVARQSKHWIKMTDADLFSEAKGIMPSLSEATREECLRLLMLHHLEKLL